MIIFRQKEYTSFKLKSAVKLGKLKRSLKELRYELDPRYTRAYHSSYDPFDIKHFYTSSYRDSGLHLTSRKPLESKIIGGKVKYKCYIKKPTHRFIDVDRNGAEMFKPNYDIQTGPVLKEKQSYLHPQYNESDSIGKRFFKKDKPGSYKEVDLKEVIFPSKKDSELKKELGKLYDKKKSLPEPKTREEDIAYDKISKDINKEVSETLSKHGKSVGVYKNIADSETLDDCYAIYDHDALKYARRINPKKEKHSILDKFRLPSRF